MIIDAFLWAGEYDMALLRLLTLEPVVDHFIAVVCTRTHQGQLVEELPDFRDLINRFPNLHGHTVEPSMRMFRQGEWWERRESERGGAGSPWYQQIESQHRDAIADAVRAFTTDSDAIVMASDVDEIPDAGLVRALATPGFVCDQIPWWAFGMRFHSTALNLLHPQQPWWGTTVSRLADCRPQEMRDARTTIGTETATMVAIPAEHSSSVHLSWMGSDEERARKLATFSHAELVGQFDPVAARAHHLHPNGEALRLLAPEEVAALSWPSPLVDDSFAPPESWSA
jgi:hypothetical protein